MVRPHRRGVVAKRSMSYRESVDEPKNSLDELDELLLNGDVVAVVVVANDMVLLRLPCVFFEIVTIHINNARC